MSPLRRLWPVALPALILAVVWGSPTNAAPPDLTAGEVPGDSITTNLGATGMRGWVYHVRNNTSESRQILIDSVDVGSPADGIIAVGDVILGADGTGAAPVAFTGDARYRLAIEIGEAEARTPATLRLLRWRAGTTDTVDITLRTMGAYSATAPYSCPKSAKILEEAIAHFYANQDSGRYSFGTLALLATDDPSIADNTAHQTRAQNEARALVPDAATIAQMMSDERDGNSMITWQRGHTLIVLTEYFLRTGDTEVMPGIEAYAVNIAKNQSLFGTMGHIFAEKTADGANNGPMGGVYGTVNSAGMPCYLGLLLARECGLANPEIGPAIERMSRFFGFYAGLGAVPYGEHEPFISHENNGKSGLAALSFMLEPGRTEECEFFTRMCTASPAVRETGHTGSYFNYLWAPLGAACGGEEAAAAHFSRISWHLDLARRWDGSIGYDCLTGEGPNSGSEYNNFRMTAAAILTYALPLRKLHVTGRGHDGSRVLMSTAVAEATASGEYDASSRSVAELVTDLGDWSPVVIKKAAAELGDRGVDAATLSQITDLANDPAGSSRLGACRALGEIGDAGSGSVLAALLTDPDHEVRFMAAEALRYLPHAARTAQLDTVLQAAASTAKPLFPFDEDDPLHFAHAKIAMLLFYNGNAYGPKGILASSINGVDRALLYPAIRAVAATPVGLARSTLGHIYDKLSQVDAEAVADAIVESVLVRSPADKMFSAGVRQGGIEVLQRYGFAEGVPLSMIYMEDDGRGGNKASALGVMELYGGGCLTVDPDPDVIHFLNQMLTGGQAAEAQAVLDAIAADPSPALLMPLKSISSVVSGSPTLTLPDKFTVLTAAASDLAQGDSIFTWRKVHGAGSVSFTPNARGDSAETTVLFEGVPGEYLFEVTMSDSRGLTEVRETVAVTLLDTGGSLPANDPPVATPQLVTVAESTPHPVTLSGVDPEGYALQFQVTSQPSHGSLSGTVPYLVYTSESGYLGPDSFTFEVMDSEGQVSAATVDIDVSLVSSYGVAIYEPFDYPAGALSGQSGTSEVGLGGAWSAGGTASIAAGSLTHGPLPVTGNSIGNLTAGSNHFGGARPIDPSALAGNGLLEDDTTLWFSVVLGYSSLANVTNSRLTLALANDSFSTGNYDYWIKNDGAQLGSGVGVMLGRINGTNGRAIATHYRDLASGDALAGMVQGSWEGTGSTIGGGAHALYVGKIVWGATEDVIELYQPDTDLNLGPVISTLTVSVDQSTYDTLTWSRGEQVLMDEIRFGATYESVLFGTVAMAADSTPPVPDPMAFAVAPHAVDPSSITMTAATAFDALGVEYYFTCTSGGGSDSGWQSSETYTDTGLTPGVAYTYTVSARDLSPAQNATAPSIGATATIPAQATVPNVIGMPRSTAESIVVAAGLSVGQVTVVRAPDAGTNEVTAQSPSGETSATYGIAVNLSVLQYIDDDYTAWAAGYPPAVLEDPSADFDGDGFSNDDERIWGLDPTDGSSSSPFVSIDGLSGSSLSYTRRSPALTGVTYRVMVSTDLVTWTEDGGASQSAGTPDANGVETVEVTLSASAVDGRLFVRIEAIE
ncbi:hypothetical protein HAHE_32620 [Haloferula helveola]|uniref:PASTA domain-containing protein n=1 Tax=Haloferula helveola TaxID=490095 RepID=A0ABN6H726_9BACT|nr:hypothetical protein HAHE_32620 [Haloferula helveola]